MLCWACVRGALLVPLLCSRARPWFRSCGGARAVYPAGIAVATYATASAVCLTPGGSFETVKKPVEKPIVSLAKAGRGRLYPLPP